MISLLNLAFFQFKQGFLVLATLVFFVCFICVIAYVFNFSLQKRFVDFFCFWFQLKAEYDACNFFMKDKGFSVYF